MPVLARAPVSASANGSRKLGRRAMRSEQRSRVILATFRISMERTAEPGLGGSTRARRSPQRNWSQRRESNPQPPDYKSGALPIEPRWLAPHEARSRAPIRVETSPGRQVERGILRVDWRRSSVRSKKASGTVAVPVRSAPGLERRPRSWLAPDPANPPRTCRGRRRPTSRPPSPPPPRSPPGPR